MGSYYRFCVSVLILNFVVGGRCMHLGIPNQRTCIIGAGYSGLGTARYLKEYGVDFTLYEATRHVGGTWRYDPHVGVDEDGVPVFTSMYKNLRTNTPRHTMEFAGFPFPESTPSYPTATCFFKYLKLFAKKFDIIPNIQFQSLVTSVRWSQDHWDVTFTKTDSRTNQTDRCDFLIIANGEYLKPVWPKIKGQDSFNGKIIHSHDYKDPEVFKGLRVLVVGAGPSGLDLAMHLSNVTAKLVHSHHLNYNQPYFGPTYVKKPDIKEIISNGVLFVDGTFEEIDVIIFCTGYDYEHSFIDDSVGLTKSGKFILPLYQHMVNIRHPNMVFIGVPKKVINRVLDAQGQYAAALAARKFELPSQDDMLQSWLNHVHSFPKKKMSIVDVNVIGDEMDNYFANLTAEAGIIRAPPVLTSIRDYNAKYRLEDLLNYRDYDYRIIDDHNYEKYYNLRKEVNCPINDETS